MEFAVAGLSDGDVRGNDGNAAGFLFGDAGLHVLNGVAGQDEQSGSLGNVFVFGTASAFTQAAAPGGIHDFVTLVDHIDLTGSGAISFCRMGNLPIFLGETQMGRLPILPITVPISGNWQSDAARWTGFFRGETGCRSWCRVR